MRRLVLIANPSASGFTGSLHREVVSLLAGPYDVTPVWPNGPAEARQAAADAAEEGYDLVVAMGGDGVVHQVANGLAGTTTGLGIIPAGTTNVLGRILRLPKQPRAAAEALARLDGLRPIPLAHLASDSREGARSEYATFSTSVGFDAEVVEVAEKRPLRKLSFGGIHYARSAAWVLWSRYRSKLPELRVEAEGRRADAVAVLVQVHQPYTYFGRIPLRFTPHPIDGLAVLVIRELRLLKGIDMVLRAAATGSLDRVSDVEVWTGVPKLIIEAEPSAWFQADGELLGRTSAVEVTPAARPLLVAVPEQVPGGSERT
ncbi:MAG: diacylglycerol/lipid kinase family protein [Acidimicrobiia bacterium]